MRESRQKKTVRHCPVAHNTPYLSQLEASRAPPKNVRATLLLGTALSAGVLAVTLAGAPQAAACTVVLSTATCQGNYPNGISYTANPVFTIEVIDSQVGGDNGVTGDGISFTASAAGQTLTVITDADTTIGTPAGYEVVDHGIYVQSGFVDTTIVIDNAASITTAFGDGIDARAAGSGTGFNSINITNDSSIGAGGTGIFGSATVIASAGGAYAFGGTANAGTTIVNSGDLTSTLSRGIDGRSWAYASGFGDFNGTGGTAVAATSITNDGTVTTSAGYVGIYSVTRAEARGVGTYYSGYGGVAIASGPVSNSGDIFSGGTSLFGASDAVASGSGPIFAVGGTAVAGETIVNSGALTSASGRGNVGRA
jgi:hypothetical protein